MIDVELTAPHHVTIGYTGQPGERTFFLQAEDTETTVTLVLEKTQAEGIATLLTELLARVDDAPATDWDRAAMELREPVEPRWRVGEIALGLDPDAGRFALELTELIVEAEDEPEDPREVRIWADRDQARRLAAHTAEVVTEGRPRCQLCGRPTAFEGDHVCPATNGHGRLTR